jgi:WD40 repeat protein
VVRSFVISCCQKFTPVFAFDEPDMPRHLLISQLLVVNQRSLTTHNTILIKTGLLHLHHRRTVVTVSQNFSSDDCHEKRPNSDPKKIAKSMASQPKTLIQSSELPPAQPDYVLRGHTAQIHCVHFLRQNLRLLTGDADGWVVLWNFAAKRPVAVWKAHGGSVLGVGSWGNEEENIVTYVCLKATQG